MSRMAVGRADLRIEKNRGRGDDDMTTLEMVLMIYRGLISKCTEREIPVRLRAKRIVGTVQDDPFDCWMQNEIKSSLPNTFEVVHSGPLTTPDLIVRDRRTGLIVGLEVKKLIRQANGRDPRGMTLDYNSCLPCGSTLVKVGDEAIVIPCFYFFALLSHDSKSIVSSILLDGDFLNYDFELHKESKYSNYTEYNHGPYGEGSIRHRKMYTYPNPLNDKIEAFSLRHVVVAKKNDFDRLRDRKCKITEQIIRTDRYGHSFYYYLDDELSADSPSDGNLVTLEGIFDACKVRKPKERVAAIPTIERL